MSLELSVFSWPEKILVKLTDSEVCPLIKLPKSKNEPVVFPVSFFGLLEDLEGVIPTEFFIKIQTCNAVVDWNSRAMKVKILGDK
jgi:hypothetical protein